MTDCEHDFIPIKMKLENGTFQLRLYCKKCIILDPKIRKVSEYPNAPEKNFAEYKAYYDKITGPQREAEFKQIQIAFQEKYKVYINSLEWDKTRQVVLSRDNYTCAICGGRGTDVHHLTYRHFENEYLFELITLCNECHIVQYHPERKL